MYKYIIRKRLPYVAIELHTYNDINETYIDVCWNSSFMKYGQCLLKKMSIFFDNAKFLQTRIIIPLLFNQSEFGSIL